MWELECPFCRLDGAPRAMTCGRCHEPLDYASRQGKEKSPAPQGWGIWKYRGFLPPVGGEPVSLREGDTPLYDCGEFLVKFEGANPTGSFKDRGMSVGLTAARARGIRLCVCASTVNTSASLAAYAARARIRCAVFVPEGKTAAGKLAQAVAYGAQVVEIIGNFDAALKAVSDAVGGRPDIELLNSVNPLRIEGQKTVAFEICDDLGGAPDAVVLPVGNGGNLRALWKGFKEYRTLGLISSLPRMIGVQAQGSAWWKEGPIENPETVATAIRIGKPANGRYARAAIAESGGRFVTVGDAEVLRAQKRLAAEFGVFVEPASAAPVAALPQLELEGRIVCIATGHGLKDPEAAVSGFRLTRLPAEARSVLNAIG